MLHHPRSPWLAASLWLAACAAPPHADVPTYPSVPLDALRPTATASEGVTQLALECTRAEQENAVDDDCDGHIDEGHGARAGALELALSWVGPEALTLEMEPSLTTASAGACAASAVCVARLVHAELAPQSALEVRVARPASEATDALTASLSVAVTGHDLGTYNVQLAPGETRQVVRITVP